ncbi:MAG: hypothetical protein H7270_07260 [Dermatophilaceae bacterium]|nr:hypothetical protein [Dermatophilaceae bacterium]
MNPESVDVTAGLGGFLAFFLLAVALYFLMRNMNGRLRRLAYREEREATGNTDTGATTEATEATETPFQEAPDSQDQRGDSPNRPD